MGNMTSSEVIDRRRNALRRIYTAPPQQPPPHPPQPQPEINPNQYVYAAGMPYPTQYYNYPQGYYPPQPQPPVPLPYQSPYDHHHHRDGSHMAGPPPNWGGYPYGPPMTQPTPPVPYIEQQKAVTVKNDVNLKKETLKLEADEENPGKFLVTFTFDSTVAGRMTVMFFAKEGEDCNLIPVKENTLQPVTLPFEQGIGQKFRQPSGTGIDFSMFEESELLKVDAADVFPLAMKAESLPANANESNGNEVSEGWNSQITLAVFEKDKGKFQARAVKQILWVNGMRYELQEIYGIGNSVNNDVDASDAGKDCVICLTEPSDTTVLPCRHMCMCSSCAQVLKSQTNRCPVCRQPVERLLEIKVNNGTDE